jgi:hypothetical protein
MTHNRPTSSSLARAQTVRELTRRLERMETARHPETYGDVVSTGIAALDALLPDGGFRSGTLVDWLADSAASGVDLLALLSARPMLNAGRVIIVFDRDKTFYPAASAAWGIALEQTIVVRPKNQAEELWALEQCLQSAGVAVSWCRLERASGRALRRLQLAVERGGGLGFLLRPLSTRGQPTWSDVRLTVTPLVSQSSHHRARLELVRSRRGAGEKSLILELDDATGLVSVVPELAATTRAPAKARA